MDAPAPTRRDAAVRWALHLALAVVVLTEQFGRTTSDTRLELTERPGRFLADAFSLWDPRVSLGEVQNQAYGYLWPQGPFHWLGQAAGLPAWVVERGWSFLLLLAAAEGARRVALLVGAGPAAAALAGFAHALGPRLVAEVGVRSAEMVPAVVLPWALLPLLHLVAGRRRPAVAALLSAAAFGLGGGVNGTATAAPAALLAVVVGWAWTTGRVDGRFVALWAALVAAVSAWWVVSLAHLGAVSPPFYDYVEDARTTTAPAGAAGTLRGAANWLDYLTSGGAPWWPGGSEVAFSPWVVAGTVLVASAGLVGLVRHRGPLRVPLLLAAGLGFALVTAAHVGAATSPLAPTLRDLLDGVLAPLRNVPKADPVLRLPLAIGLGLLAQEAGTAAAARWRDRSGAGWRHRARVLPAAGLVAVLGLGVVLGGAPVLQGRTRTPGWTALPSAWREASALLDRQSAAGRDGAVWVVPGSGFAIQSWGWTMEEPLQVLGGTPWVTRSQVPLVPAATIRLLSSLEDRLASGLAVPGLAATLRRVGIDRVVWRRDLAAGPAQGIDPDVVGRALARSRGLRVAGSFGTVGLGPQVEVLTVRGTTPAARLLPAAGAVTVASSVEDVVAAIGAGLLPARDPALVPGDPGVPADRPVDVLGDGYRRRERDFGRVHDAVSAVMTADEPEHGERLVTDYPGPPGARPAVARDGGVSAVSATSSAGWADVLGPIRPENAPWAAVDGDPGTWWSSAPYLPPDGQGIVVDLRVARRVGELVLRQPVAVLGLPLVPRWRVALEGAGGGPPVVRTLEVDPVTGVARADLGALRATRLAVTAVDPAGRGPATLAEVVLDAARPGATADVAAGGTPLGSRTLVLPAPDGGTAPGASLVLGGQPETRACAPTLLGPDCDPARARASEESVGLDRTFTLDHAGRYGLSGAVVARSRPGTLALLDPPAGRGARASASSWLGQDPAVSARMATDGDPRTTWIADPRDPAPTLTLELPRAAAVSGVAVDPPTGGALRPTRLVVTGGGERRAVPLDVLGAGPARATFAPLRGRRLELTLTRPGALADGDPVGVAGVRLLAGGRARPATVPTTVPLDGGEPTGAPCGLGPRLLVDGVPHPTRVSGPLGAVVAGGRLRLRACGPSIDLAAGTHRLALVSTEQFQPVDARLVARSGAGAGAGAGAVPAARRAPADPRPLEVVRRADDALDLRVGPGAASVLALPQSHGDGWTASLVTPGGRTALTALQVDGWAQGFAVPAGAGGTIEVRFTPQRGYLRDLVAGLVVLALVQLAALGALVLDRVGRPRRSAAARAVRPAHAAPAAPAAPAVRPRRGGRVATPVAAGLALAAALLASGPFAAVAGTAGVLVARGPRLGHGAARLLGWGWSALLALALVVAGVLVVHDAGVGDGRASGLADQLTAVAFWGLLALGLARRPEAP